MLALQLVTSLLAIVLLILFLRERTKRKGQLFTRRLPIREVLPEEVDPAFHPGAHGPGREAEVAYIGRGPYTVAGGTSDAEAWILAVVAKRAHRLFEFGTCTGKTAYLWARNAPPDARVVTLTLPPEQRAQYRTEEADDATDVRYALRESAFTSFLYSGSDVEPKIEQLYGDSKTIDLSPWAGSCDVVFVDGSHAYSYVVSDSEKALQLVRPGGLVLWHDYAGPHHAIGVFRALNELAARLPLVHIAGTTLVAYRRAAETAAVR